MGKKVPIYKVNQPDVVTFYKDDEPPSLSLSASYFHSTFPIAKVTLVGSADRTGSYHNVGFVFSSEG